MSIVTTIDKIRYSVVQICTSSDGINFSIRGTGFIVEDGYILTANHVVDGLQPDEIYLGLAGINVDKPEMQVRAAFLYEHISEVHGDEVNDIAVIVPRTNHVGEIITGGNSSATVKALRFDFSRPKDGERVTVSGYPLSEVSLVSNHGIIASSWCIKKGTGEEIYLGDFTANPGNRGGPIYNSAGRVIGVCVAGRLASHEPSDSVYAAGLTEIVPSSYCKQLLDRL